jgi:hypothetical protein
MSPLLLHCPKCQIGWHHDAEEERNHRRVKYHHKHHHLDDEDLAVDLKDVSDTNVLLDDNNNDDCNDVGHLDHQTPAPLVLSNYVTPREAIIRSFHDHRYTMNFALESIEGGKPLSYLVAICVYQNALFSKDITDVDRKLFITAAKIALTGSSQSRENMGDLMMGCTLREEEMYRALCQKEIENRALRHLILRLSPTHQPSSADLPPSLIPRRIPLPCTPNLIRSMFREGKFAYREVIPVQRSTSIAGHAVNGIGSSLAHSLLNPDFVLAEIPKSVPRVTTALCQSPAAVAIRTEMEDEISIHGLVEDIPRLPIFLILWLDDAERMSSMRNRVSIWHLTGTISPSSSESIYTHYLANGNKGADHNPVVQTFVDELPSLQGPSAMIFFYAAMQIVIRAHVKVLLVICDQIEKRAALFVGAGNHLYHNIMGVSANLTELGFMYRACQTCANRNKMLLDHDLATHKQRYDHLWSPPTISNLGPDGCPDCVNWSPWLLPSHPHAKMVPPKNYPPCQIPADGFLRCKELTMAGMKAAVMFAHCKFVLGLWTEDVLRAYLWVECLNGSGVRLVLLHAKNCVTAQKGFLDEWILRERDANPDLYKPWLGPAFWHLGVCFKDFVNAPMHIWFLGVVKKFFERIVAWNKANGTTKQFSVYTRNLMEALKRLGLGWLQADTFRREASTEKVNVGGWISANYVCFARILPWFVAGMETFPGIDIANYEPPDKVVKKWTVPENRAWLAAHGIYKGHLLLKAPALREFVAAARDSVPPPQLAPTKASPFSTLAFATSSLVSLLAEVMQRDIDKRRVWRVDRKIKIFLSAFDSFSGHLDGISEADDVEIAEILDDEAGDEINCGEEDDEEEDGEEGEDDTSTGDHDGVAIGGGIGDGVAVGGGIGDGDISGEEAGGDTGGDQPTTQLEGTPHVNSGQLSHSLFAKYAWVKSYNFCCLPYVPRDLERFGSVHNYFEGCFVGEKFLIYPKRSCLNMRKSPHFFNNLMDNVTTAQFVERMDRLEPKGVNRLAPPAPNEIKLVGEEMGEGTSEGNGNVRNGAEEGMEVGQAGHGGEERGVDDGVDDGVDEDDGVDDGVDEGSRLLGDGLLGVPPAFGGVDEEEEDSYEEEVDSYVGDPFIDEDDQQYSNNMDHVDEVEDEDGMEEEEEEEEEYQNEYTIPPKEEWYRRVKQYRNAAVASHDFWHGVPLSVVILTTGSKTRYYMVLKGTGGSRTCICLERNYQIESVWKVGFSYESFTGNFGKANDANDGRMEIEVSCLIGAKHCVALPLLGPNGLSNPIASVAPMYSLSSPKWYIFQRGRHLMYGDARPV